MKNKEVRVSSSQANGIFDSIVWGSVLRFDTGPEYFTRKCSKLNNYDI